MRLHNYTIMSALTVLIVLCGTAQAQQDASASFTTLSNPTITEVPKDALANKSMKEVRKIQEFFEVPENRIKYQFPILESAYGWQNMGRVYNTVDVLRGGAVSDLPLVYDPSIGDIEFKRDGKTETVNGHLDAFPVDAFLVAHRGKMYSSATTPCDRRTNTSGSRPARWLEAPSWRFSSNRERSISRSLFPTTSPNSKGQNGIR